MENWRRRGFISLNLVFIMGVVTIIVAWFTHVIHCLLYAKYLLLIVGGFVVPIGVIHGIGLWFGMTW